MGRCPGDWEMGHKLFNERTSAHASGAGAIGAYMGLVLILGIAAFIAVVSIDTVQQRRQNLQ
jgi:hypothetical protein